MFKLESYITPIILSYVNRYVNNFKTEDSQVSLWGGDATFHNLELNLEVLEQELQLPFSFVSGNIRELSIHVPWTKIASEPIKITINTIECILNLKGKGSAKTPQRQKAKEKKSPGQSKSVEAPPGYIQSLINKIVGNICIYCNNLILKYVEEDIVLSMNVRLLKYESANDKWEPSYTDLSPAQVILRKVISVNDLTLCLDKRNASGKIEVYQEPMLYRCSMTIHLLRNYHSATANKASITRLDIYCNNMEFSMTEQQVPMLMRLLMLLYALQQKQLKAEEGSFMSAAGSSNDLRNDNGESNETWTGWAWSYVSSVLPTPWDTEWNDEDFSDHKGHTLQFGLYVDRASVTFKVSEPSSDKTYYHHKKLRYWPMLTLDLQGIYSDTIIHGLRWFNCTGGVSEATLIPAGHCSCGSLEVNEGTAPYLKIGAPSNYHKSDSLFDADAVENNGERRHYNTCWEHHMVTNTESVLLERTPAFAFDYLYQLVVPDDSSSDILSELGSNYEFSNLSETSALRLCVGPLRLRVCSGLLHRFSTLLMAASFYDYPPYYTPKLDASIQDLLPPSEEDFDALTEFIPTRSMRLTLFAPQVELDLMDHPFFEPTKTGMFRRNKKVSASNMSTSSSTLPKITVECQFIDMSAQYPMYVNRLVHTTCQLPEPPEKLFDACYTKRSIKIVGLLSRLVINPVCQSIILTPSSMSYSVKTILKPQYWTNPNIAHNEVVFESESVTLNATKAKLLVLYNIVEKMLLQESDPGKSIYGSSLLTDACRDFGFPYMEICIEGVRFQKVTTNSTETLDMNLECIRAFVFESVDAKNNLRMGKGVAASDIQQVLFLSGPESTASKEPDAQRKKSEAPDSNPLFTITLQYPLRPTLQKHAPIVIFNLREVRICIDPLLCKWFLYVPKNFLFSDIQETPPVTKIKPEASVSGLDTPRKFSSHQIGSVHSSSDRDHKTVLPRKLSEIEEDGRSVDMQERVYNVLKTWFDVWKGIYLYGDVSQCSIYFPTVSLSAIGSQGIQQAVEGIINEDNPPDIMVITLPFANIRSAQRQSIKSYLKELPITLPSSLWSLDKSSFPWTMSVSDLSCYTIQAGKKLTFLKPVTLSATVGLSTRPSKASLSSGNEPDTGTGNPGQGTKDDSSATSTTGQKRKGSRNTNASAGNPPHVRNTTSSAPNSPNNQTPNTDPEEWKSSSTKMDIGYLGVCVHIDMTPVIISTSEVQVYLFASILYGLMEVAQNLLPIPKNKPGLVKTTPPDVLPTPFIAKGSTTTSPTVQNDDTDHSSQKTPPLNDGATTHVLPDNDSVKLTAWIQWTITRFTMELLSCPFKDNESELESSQPKLKLILDAEDIVSSVDFQSVYLKIKSKIGSASIRHFERSSPGAKWVPGPFSGIVMRLREDLSPGQRQEDNSLISVVLTRASCQHTHTLWGAVSKKHKDKKDDATRVLSQSRYITEIVVNVQPLDFIISLSTLRSFYLVLIPLLNIPVSTLEPEKTDSVSSNSFLQSVNNQTLPLAYLDCQDIRIIMPSTDLLGVGGLHDSLVFQMQKVNLSPQAVNPICRTPIRSDIYDQAAHARILNVPGSDVEDRQYQMDLIGISLSTGTWDDIHGVLSPKNSVLSDLRGMSENPALEWNILEKGQPNVTPTLNLRCIVEKFDISLIAAPAMIYKDNTTICGHAVEINFVSDIFVNLSLHQIKVLSAVLTEFVKLVTPFIVQDGVLKKPKITFPYTRLESIGLERGSEREVAVIEGLNKDSGIETSDVKSVQSVKGQGALLRQSSESDKQHVFPRPPNTVSYLYHSVPLEILLAAGKVSFTLYSAEDERNTFIKYKGKKKRSYKKADEDQGYEASEESTDDRADNHKKYTPLFYVCINQPNAFFIKQQLGRKLQLSCFDVKLKLSGPEYPAVNHVPNEADFPVNLLETKRGAPNPSNGILPAFFILKFIKGVGKKSKIELDISKPTKILCKTSKWSYLLSLKDKVVDTFKSGGGSDSFLLILKATANQQSPRTENLRNSRVSETYSKFQEIKDILGNTNAVSVNFDQIIFAVSSESGHELHVGVQKLKSHLTLNTRPEKLCLVTTFECLTLTVIHESFRKLLLNPWTVTFDACVFWESWQDNDSDPQVQITMESDCIAIDATAEQLKCVEMVMKDVNEFLTTLPQKESTVRSVESLVKVERDQYYKDDLRAGAFQFIDSNTDNSDEMPLPYQVMFWSKTISAMAWKYPQPRALTKVRVYPVPYKMALDSQENILMLCHLEYWSDCRNCYLPYTQFYLSESEVCHLNLPKSCPKIIVASVWRVVITAIDENTEENMIHKVGISPRALAACMRIDSYFNKSLIPNLTAALYITKIELSLYNYFPKRKSVKLPECLQKYSPDFAFPENQKFLTLSVDNLSSYVSTWSSNIISTEITGALSSSVLDYAFLTQQSFLDTFTCKLEFCLHDGFQCNVVSKPIQVNFGPSIAHTLAVSLQMWTQNGSLDDDDAVSEFVIVTRMVICNDTNVGIRLAQWGTEEDVLLPSRKFNLYTWRSQKKKQYLRVAIEETDWIWSKAFSVTETGRQVIHFNGDKNISIYVAVKNLSKTQKQVTFFGQLIVYNMLSEHFEMKVVEAVTDNKETEFRNAQSHIAAAKSSAPSLFVNNRKMYFLRLRFYGLDSAWTGDIPLREHAVDSQPWLVKVPLKERGHFLSVWCRIFIQDFQKSKMILAVLWPLFMVKSNLPMSVKVHIETPTLKVHLDSVVNGKGEPQQLYCPGTIDHSHQITFQLETENTCKANNPYVPLNYSLVDQQKFFKRFSSDDIDTVLESLSSCFRSKWPYFGDELDDIEWIVDDNQPLTHVQVKYQNSSKYSCALLVELLPWCLMVNTLGTPISLMLNGVELCRLPHHGIMAPPKLEENFHLGVSKGNQWFFSGPLQLAKSDWSQSFYMPKITGTIPLEGIIRCTIKCETYVCMVSVTSSISNEIRLLKMSSSHVISNYLSTQIHVICLAVPDPKDILELPTELEKFCFTLAPQLQKSHSGIPILQWFIVNLPADAPNVEYALYIMFSVNPTLGWSSPIRVDKPLMRKSFSVQNQNLSIPAVLTAQEIKGQVYLAIHNDPRPQVLIENKTKVQFYCAQALPDDSGVVEESEHFRHACKVRSMSSVYYNMPGISEKFPELPQTYFSEKLSLGYSDDESESTNIEWSAGVSIVNNNTLFIRVPYYGDVRLTIHNTACITFVTIESGSQVEISARDIRVRLSMRQTEKDEPLLKANRELEKFIKDTLYEDVVSTSSSTEAPPKAPSFQSLPTVSEHNQQLQVMKRDKDQPTCLPLDHRSTILTNTIYMKQGWKSFTFNVYVRSVVVCLWSDSETDDKELFEVSSLTCDNIMIAAVQTEQLDVKVSVSDIQLDNQLFTRESYDFPVVLISQERKQTKKVNILSMTMEQLMESFAQDEMHVAEFVLESWRNESANKSYTGIKSLRVRVNPISCFVEDIFVTRLMQHLRTFNVIELVLWPARDSIIRPCFNSSLVNVPELVSWQCAILAHPLIIRSFSVSPLSVLLSIHSSMKIYIALDQSPLQFGKFERKRLYTTPYRLGHALTMHYLSGAIFGAGWVVSSLELLGSPGGLARAMGTGLRDFVSLPYRGLVQGPWAFLKGITTGSASLMRHVTAGTLQSVTKLASSVARNLDRLTLDEEHQKRAEEQRRQRPQGVAQGFMQGMTNLGISLLGAVGGIAHHPLQSVMADGASTRSLVAGVGLGIVGVFTKPLSGAAELVAMTGQGLLQGAGWNSLPDPRRHPQTQNIGLTTNSTLKYSWKFVNLLSNHILFVTEATGMSQEAIYGAVALILTTDNVVVIALDGDEVNRVLPLKELTLVASSDPTLLSIKHVRSTPTKKDLEKTDDDLAIPMDPEMRARVADYVRSTVGLLNLPDVDSTHSEISISPLSSPNADDETLGEATLVSFYMSAQKIKYFTCLFNLAKRQTDGNHFPVL